jgi:hypothetical protein
VVIRHWRRSHTKDGATAYRLDWNGLSFCWTGDGRPDELTAEFAKGVDVFVTEVQPDTMALQEKKMGLPQKIGENTIDIAHTVHYALGYLINQVRSGGGDVSYTSQRLPATAGADPGTRNSSQPGVAWGCCCFDQEQQRDDRPCRRPGSAQEQQRRRDCCNSMCDARSHVVSELHDWRIG